MMHKGYSFKLSLSQLEKVIDSIDEAILGCDRHGYINIYNKANEEREKMDRKEMFNRKVSEEYDLHGSESILMKAMRTGKSILNQYQEYTVLRSGAQVEVICSTVPIIENGEVIGAVSTIKDYSNVKKLSEIIMNLQSSLVSNTSSDSNNKKASPVSFGNIIGENASVIEALAWARKAAANNLPVLLYGETGTGKELLAKGIHYTSSRKENPFIAINCAAIPENLLEGILFGTTKGSFTGALDRPGIFEQASTGTLVLDEINSMSLSLQSKLLRAIQEKAIRRVGGVKEIPVDTRLISITNVDPATAVAKGQLRDDLYYRIAYITLALPPLKDRIDDLPLLVEFLINKYNQELSLVVEDISNELFDQMKHYKWPGNIRELEHLIAAGMSSLKKYDKSIGVNDIPPHLQMRLKTYQVTGIDYQIKPEHHGNVLAIIEKTVIEDTLKSNNNVIAKTARELGIKRQTLQYKLKKHGIKIA